MEVDLNAVPITAQQQAALIDLLTRMDQMTAALATGAEVRCEKDQATCAGRQDPSFSSTGQASDPLSLCPEGGVGSSREADDRSRECQRRRSGDLVGVHAPIRLILEIV